MRILPKTFRKIAIGTERERLLSMLSKYLENGQKYWMNHSWKLHVWEWHLEKKMNTNYARRKGDLKKTCARNVLTTWKKRILLEATPTHAYICRIIIKRGAQHINVFSGFTTLTVLCLPYSSISFTNTSMSTTLRNFHANIQLKIIENDQACAKEIQINDLTPAWWNRNASRTLFFCS